MTRTEEIPLQRLRVGHMIRHEGVVKIVDGLSAGYPDMTTETWSLRVTFTDATTLFIPWPDSKVTTEIITGF